MNRKDIIMMSLEELKESKCNKSIYRGIDNASESRLRLLGYLTDR